MQTWVFNTFLALYVLLGLLFILLMVRINVQINNALAGSSGVSGAQGPPGGQGGGGGGGGTGPSGGSGASGISGGSGPPGLFGAQGASGLDGTSGPSGIAGGQGASGVSGASGMAATDTLNNYSMLWCSFLPGPAQLGWDSVHSPYNYTALQNSTQIQYGGQTKKTTGAICLQVNNSYWAGSTVPWDRFKFGSKSLGGWATANSDPAEVPHLTLQNGINVNDTLVFANDVVTMGTYYMEIVICDMVDAYCSVLLDDLEITTHLPLHFTPAQTPPVLPYTFINQNGWLAVNMQRNLSHYTEGFSGPTGNAPLGFAINTDFTWHGFVGIGPSGPHTLKLFYQGNTYPVPNISPTDRLSIPLPVRFTRGSLALLRISDVVLT